MQLIEEEIVTPSETSKKRGLQSSLTYWKLKNKGVKICNYILKIKELRGKTCYRPHSSIIRIETKSRWKTPICKCRVTDHIPA